MASDRSKRENHQSEKSGGTVSPQAPICADEESAEYDDEFFEAVEAEGEVVYSKGVEVFDSPAGSAILCVYKWKGQYFSCDEIEWRGPYDTLDDAVSGDFLTVGGSKSEISFSCSELSSAEIAKKLFVLGELPSGFVVEINGEEWEYREPREFRRRRVSGTNGVGVREFDPLAAVPPAAPHEERRWMAHPVEEAVYEKFVGALLADASRAHGLTLRNAVIDFSSDVEGSAVHRAAGGPEQGWCDTDSEYVGSVSRTLGAEVVAQHPCRVVRFRRELALISLDVATKTADDTVSFHRRVICPLLALARTHPLFDHLYRWLDALFGFCPGNPVAYLSRYEPSPHIRALAARHGVDIAYQPLSVTPEGVLNENQTFRLLSVTRKQWEALVAGLGQSGEGRQQ